MSHPPRAACEGRSDGYRPDVKQPDDEVELPEDQIRAVEDGSPPHHHGAFDDVAFLDHLRSCHGLDTPDHLSRATLEGLHDRLHDESDAAAD